MTQEQLIFIALGCFGGLVPELLRIIKNRLVWKKFPDEYKTAWFWFSLLVQVSLGGVVAILLQPTRELDAVIYGYAAPELVTRLVTTVTKPQDEQPAPAAAGTDPGATRSGATSRGSGGSLLDWWRF